MKNQIKWVKLPNGKIGYVLEYKADKTKVQLTDSNGFTIWHKQPDWCETKDLKEIESPITKELFHNY